MVTVRFFAGAAQAAGCRTTAGDWAGLTTEQLLRQLAEQFPNLKPILPALTVAVNREYVSLSQPLREGDEVAIIPPVSGGEHAEPLFEVVETPLSADRVMARVIDPTIGAVDLFVGTVREWTRDRQTIYLEYEAYAEMAVEQMARIGDEIRARWSGARVAISHRIGKMDIGEVSVVIAVATPHRDDAFAACRHAIERLKQIVPIWKKETWADGEEWVGSQAGPAWMHPELQERQ